MKHHCLLSTCCVLALLAGCQTAPSKTVLMSESDPAVQALNEAAMRVARSAEQAALASSVGGSRGRVTQEYRIDLSRVPPEMRKPVLLEGGFEGEISTFLESLTDVVGWGRPVYLGRKPTTPLIVTFAEQRRAPAEWIADAGYQVGEQAHVSINSSLRQIVVTYAEAGGVR